MKKTAYHLILIGVIICFSIPTFAQWAKLNLPPTSSHAFNPQPTSKSDMWALTNVFGIDNSSLPVELLHTQNAGQTFAKSTLTQNGNDLIHYLDPLNNNIAALIVINFVTGDFTLRKTTNGGQTWQDLPYKPHTFPDMLHFYDANNAIYMADPDSLGIVVQYTTDGGATFTRISNSNLPTLLPNEAGLIGGAKFIGDNIFMETIESSDGISFDNWRIWRSTNKGRTWTASPSWTKTTDFRMGDYEFSDSQNGIQLPLITKPFNYARFTNDGGRTWNQSGKLPSDKILEIVNLPNTQTFVALFGDTTRGKVFIAITNDFGKTWNTFKELAPYKLDAIDSVYESILVTFPLAPFSFADLSIIDNHTAWARFSRTDFYRYDSPIPIVPEKPDLDLTFTADTEGLPLYGSIKFTLTLTNRGITPATGVKVNWLPPYKRTNNGVGAFAYQAAYSSTGWYDSWNGIWSIDQLDAGASATATFHLFVVDARNNATQTAQVIACNESDLDSSPNNMTSTAREDDEVSFTSKPNVSNFGIPEFKSQPSVLSVSPNPTKDILNININSAFDKDWTLQILNSIGQTVFNQKGQANQIMNIDVKSFENGIYLIAYESEGEKKVEKVMIQH